MGRAHRTTERIVHIAHSCNSYIPQQFTNPCAINPLNLLQGFPCGNKASSFLVVKDRTQCRSTAATAVVCGTAT